jgi:hypothetical protein
VLKAEVAALRAELATLHGGPEGSAATAVPKDIP